MCVCVRVQYMHKCVHVCVCFVCNSSYCMRRAVQGDCTQTPVVSRATPASRYTLSAFLPNPFCSDKPAEVDASIRSLPLLPDTVSPKLVKRTGSLNHRGQEQNGDKVSAVEPHRALPICIEEVHMYVRTYVRAYSYNMYICMYLRMYVCTRPSPVVAL